MIMNRAAEAVQAEFTGTGDYSLTGALSARHVRFRDKRSNGAQVAYSVQTKATQPTANGPKWEDGIGELTVNGSGIDTLSRETILGSSNNGDPVDWLSTDLPVVYSAINNDQAAANLNYFVDKGAANYEVTADDIGAIFTFDLAAGHRVCTLPLGAPLSRWFKVGVYGANSTGNHVALTPISPDWINEGSAGVALDIAGGQLKFVRWDIAAGAWRTHG